jgi:hypothetical protein
MTIKYTTDHEALKTETDWFRMQRLKPHEFDEICQCNTEKLIKRSTDPKRMRSSLLSLVFFDQFVYSHYPELHNDFRAEFQIPKLRQHSFGGHASPSWLIYSRHDYDKEADWELVSNTFYNCVSHLRQWLQLKLDNPVPELEKKIENEITSEFETEHQSKFIVPNGA